MFDYYNNKHDKVNIGTGQDIAIKDVAILIKKIVGYTGEIKHDLTKPDGTPRKLMNVEKLNQAGWTAQIELEKGIQSVYENLKNEDWY